MGLVTPRGFAAAVHVALASTLAQSARLPRGDVPGTLGITSTSWDGTPEGWWQGFGLLKKKQPPPGIHVDGSSGEVGSHAHNLEAIVASLPRGGSSGFGEEEPQSDPPPPRRRKIKKRLDRLCSYMLQQECRLKAGVELVDVLSMMLEKDMDGHGDIMPQHLAFWETVAERLVQLCAPDQINIGWTSVVAAKSKGKPMVLQVDTAMYLLESPDVKAMAALLLLLIADAVQPEAFERSLKVLCMLWEVNGNVFDAYVSTASNRVGLQDIGEFLTFHGHCKRSPLHHQALVERFEKLVVADRMPERLRRLAASDIIDGLKAEKDPGEREIMLRSLWEGVPHIKLTPASVDWWTSSYFEIFRSMRSTTPLPRGLDDAYSQLLRRIRMRFRAAAIHLVESNASGPSGGGALF